MLVSSQHGDKWMAKGQFRLQNDDFPRKDWGESKCSVICSVNFTPADFSCLSFDGQKFVSSSGLFTLCTLGT